MGAYLADVDCEPCIDKGPRQTLIDRLIAEGVLGPVSCAGTVSRATISFNLIRLLSSFGNPEKNTIIINRSHGR